MNRGQFKDPLTIRWISVRLLIQWSLGRTPPEVTFFAVVKSFDATMVISSNFVLTVKNSIKPFTETYWQLRQFKI